jgi:hypothetical protein
MDESVQSTQEIKERGTVERDGFEALEVTRQAETSITAAAEHAKAVVQARYIVALKRPRNIEDARVRILTACKRPRFADAARYKKPIWEDGKKKFLRDASIKFADEAAKLMGNIDVDQPVLYEDEEIRKVKVSATDLETNVTKSQEIIITKTVERRSAKGREVIGKRLNSYGDRLYIVKATDAEVILEHHKQLSIVRRNLELQLIPQDIVDEAMDICIAVVEDEAAKDPAAAKKAVIDAFAAIGVNPSALEKYLGHSIGNASPPEIQDLREVYRAIEQGEAVWTDFVTPENAEDKEHAGKINGLKEKLRQKTGKQAEEPKQDDPPPENGRRNCRVVAHIQSHPEAYIGKFLELDFKEEKEGIWERDNLTLMEARDYVERIQEVPDAEKPDKTVTETQAISVEVRKDGEKGGAS